MAVYYRPMEVDLLCMGVITRPLVVDFGYLCVKFCYLGVYFWASKSRFWVADKKFGSSFLASVKRNRALIVDFIPHGVHSIYMGLQGLYDSKLLSRSSFLDLSESTLGG